MRNLFLVCLTLIILKPVIILSEPPCEQNTNLNFIKLPLIKNYPGTDTLIPADIRLGYLWADSLAKEGYIDESSKHIEEQSFDDTIQIAMKYWYKMADYDPFILKQFIHYANKSFTNVLSDYQNEILRRLREVAPSPNRYIFLTQSDIIAHVRITDTSSILKPGSYMCRRLFTATCKVLDTLKGMKLPDTLEFTYCDGWRRKWTNETFIDSIGKPWIQKGKEYIVFLQLGTDCVDSTDYYFDLSPFASFSNTWGMYPVIKGMVSDPVDELWWGKSIPVDEFKSKLRDKIKEIVSFGN